MLLIGVVNLELHQILQLLVWDIRHPEDPAPIEKKGGRLGYVQRLA
jgi:hypothetical protein